MEALLSSMILEEAERSRGFKALLERIREATSGDD